MRHVTVSTQLGVVMLKTKPKQPNRVKMISLFYRLLKYSQLDGHKISVRVADLSVEKKRSSLKCLPISAIQARDFDIKDGPK